MSVEDFLGHISPEGRVAFLEFGASEGWPDLLLKVEVTDKPEKLRLTYMVVEPGANEPTTKFANVDSEGLPDEVRTWLNGTHLHQLESDLPDGVAAVGPLPPAEDQA